MQKFNNDSSRVIDEMLEAYIIANADLVSNSENEQVIKYKNAPIEGKVRNVIAGGSSCKPASIGYVGCNMVDDVACIELFSSPPAQMFNDTVKAADGGKEYNEITGLGGWGGRNKKSGPYYYWKGGAYLTDNSPGDGGKHGKRVPFVINIRDTEHPITKGLPTKWLHQNDELYGNLRGPGENIHVLATAFSMLLSVKLW